MRLGQYNRLKVLRHTSVGLFLGDESDEDVLLPNKYCPDDVDVDDEIDVFIYLDYAERKIATTLVPKIVLNEFAYLKVNAVTDVGAFLDWGLEKDLFVPFGEQRPRMNEGKFYVVFLTIDDKTDRLYATNRVENFLSNDDLDVSNNDEVNLLVMHKTDLGFSVIINNKFRGLIYDNEIFFKVKTGDSLKGFIKNIRDDDKIDVSLQPIGYNNFIDKNCDLVYQQLLQNRGFLRLHDKSSPDEIYSMLKISKKAFKKAVGSLFKQKKISIENDGIKLIKP